jgi:hypothetical protein
LVEATPIEQRIADVPTTYEEALIRTCLANTALATSQEVDTIQAKVIHTRDPLIISIRNLAMNVATPMTGLIDARFAH